MSVLDIVFIIMCLGIIASLIIQIIKIEPLEENIKNMKMRLDAIDKKIEKNTDHTDIRILKINRIMDSNVAGHERYGEAIKQNTDKINILVDRVNKITELRKTLYDYVDTKAAADAAAAAYADDVAADAKAYDAREMIND